MSKFLRTIFYGFVVLSLLGSLSARADQAFQRFLPLFVELDGWQGKKPDGMSMEMSNMSMTTANRDNQKGAAQVHASVVVGQTAAGRWRRCKIR